MLKSAEVTSHNQFSSLSVSHCSHTLFFQFNWLSFHKIFWNQIFNTIFDPFWYSFRGLTSSELSVFFSSVSHTLHPFNSSEYLKNIPFFCVLQTSPCWNFYFRISTLLPNSRKWLIFSLFRVLISNGVSRWSPFVGQWFLISLVVASTSVQKDRGSSVWTKRHLPTSTSVLFFRFATQFCSGLYATYSLRTIPFFIRNSSNFLFPNCIPMLVWIHLIFFPFWFSQTCAKPLQATQAFELCFKNQTSLHLEESSVMKYLASPFDSARISPQISEWMMSRISVFLFDVFGNWALVIFLRREIS